VLAVFASGKSFVLCPYLESDVHRRPSPGLGVQAFQALQGIEERLPPLLHQLLHGAAGIAHEGHEHRLRHSKDVRLWQSRCRPHRTSAYPRAVLHDVLNVPVRPRHPPVPQ